MPTQERVIEARDTSSFLTVLWYIVIVLAFVGGNVSIYRWGQFHIIPYRALLALYWVVFAMLVFLDRGKLTLPIFDFEIKLYFAFYALWFSYGVISLLWVVSRVDGLRHIFFLFSGMSIVFFTLYNTDRSRRLEHLYAFWIIAVVCLIGIGVWENFTGHHLPNSHVIPEYGFIRPVLKRIPSGVYTNPNDYATFLCLTVPFSYCLFRYSSNILIRALSVVLILFAVYFIFFTSSRANMIALVVEVLAVVFILVKKRQLRFLKRIAAIFLLCVVVFFIVYYSGDSLMSKKFRQLKAEIVHLTHGDESISNRENLIRNGIIFLRDTMLIGVGAGNNEWYQGNRYVYPTENVTSMHNWWMELLVDYGIFIFLLYLAFYISLIRNLYRATRGDSGIIGILAESLFISLVGFSIASISSSSIFGDRTIWFLFATAITVVNLYKRERAST